MCTVQPPPRVNPIAVNKYDSINNNIKRLAVWRNNTHRYRVNYPIRRLHSHFHYYFKGARPGVFLTQLNHKTSVNTTKFHQNHTTCFGPLDPSSSAHRSEICTHMLIITCLSHYLWDSILHNKSYHNHYNHCHWVTTQLQLINIIIIIKLYICK